MLVISHLNGSRSVHHSIGYERGGFERFNAQDYRMGLIRNDRWFPIVLQRIVMNGDRRVSAETTGGKYQGKMWPLLRPERIGVTLTEESQLEPEQSTSALIAHHPQARYFKA